MLSNSGKALSLGVHLASWPDSAWAGHVGGVTRGCAYVTTRENRLWALVTPAVGQAAHHLVVDDVQAEVGDAVYVARGQLTCGRVTVALGQDTPIFEGRPAARDIAEAVRRHPVWPSALDPAAAQAAAGLHQDPLAAADGLLGRGPGLTPAGDDVLVGYLAILAAAGHGGLPGTRWRSVLAALGAWLPRHLRRTGRVSRALLTAAIEGRLPEAAFDVVTALAREAEPSTARLRQVGATSGAHLEAGLQAAFHTLAQEMVA